MSHKLRWYPPLTQTLIFSGWWGTGKAQKYPAAECRVVHTGTWTAGISASSRVQHQQRYQRPGLWLISCFSTLWLGQDGLTNIPVSQVHSSKRSDPSGTSPNTVAPSLLPPSDSLLGWLIGSGMDFHAHCNLGGFPETAWHLEAGW